jgi:hypothetical protein
MERHRRATMASYGKTAERSGAMDANVTAVLAQAIDAEEEPR